MPYPTPSPYPVQSSASVLHPGGFVRCLGRPEATYQVISIDEETDSCWVRRWPLTRHGSPAFSVASSELRPLPAPGR